MKKVEETKELADTTKRDFIKKFGNYAASASLAGFVLMTPNASAYHVRSVICKQGRLQ